jgi:hypothetical protein
MAEQLAPGQVWRLKDGQVVRIAEVSGDDVNGTSQLGSRTSSGAPVHAGSANWAGRRADFEGAELAGPLLRVSFLFPAALPQDPIFDALNRIGSVEHRSSARIETGSGPEGQNLNLSDVEWTVDVVAGDRESAKQRVREALEAFGEVKDGSMDAKELSVNP